MKHTKRKWAWQLFGDTYYLTAQRSMREIIIGSIVIDPNHPNAKLLKKSPEMHKALEWLVTGITEGSLIVFTDDDQHKCVKEDNAQKMDELFTLYKEIEFNPSSKTN